MKVTYYPGCTLRNKAQQLDLYARRCAALLGTELVEPAEWQCCGGVYVTAGDEIASKLSSVRALIAARDAGGPLITVCSACHNVIKQTNYAMANDPTLAARVNAYLAQERQPPAPYHGETRVYHYLEWLRDCVGFDRLRAAVTHPLTGRRIGAYYGCLLLRPGRVMAFDDVENPRLMEDLIRALGAEPVIYPQRNECCGGYIALEDPAAAARRSAAVTDSAAAHGVTELLTACPLCRYNLVKNGSPVPVTYFTELVAEALGVKDGDGRDERKE